MKKNNLNLKYQTAVSCRVSEDTKGLIKGRERKIQDIRETNQEKKNQRYGKRRKVIQKERRVDALALRADERRDKLRKALGSCK